MQYPFGTAARFKGFVFAGTPRSTAKRSWYDPLKWIMDWLYRWEHRRHQNMYSASLRDCQAALYRSTGLKLVCLW